MNYDELVNVLRNCVLSKPCSDCPYYDDHGPTKECAGLNITAADAIEELQQTVNHYKGCADDWYKEACDYKTALPRWISVKERLPEKDGWYQVYAPHYSGGSSSGLKNINGNMYSGFKNGKWSIEVGYHKRPGCVKAWMPLPEPPKEDEA